VTRADTVGPDPEAIILELLTDAGECATIAHVFTAPEPRFGREEISRREWTDGFFAGDAATAASELGGETVAAGEETWVLRTDPTTGASVATHLRPAGQLRDGTPLWSTGNDIRRVDCPETGP
jgi:hypothetical protein